jgi:hypothetical protein
MQTNVDTTTKHLGELAAMAHQTEAAERRILSIATRRLAEVQQQIEKSWRGAITTNGVAYMDLIRERGQLNQVIAKANQVLSN